MVNCIKKTSYQLVFGRIIENVQIFDGLLYVVHGSSSFFTGKVACAFFFFFVRVNEISLSG